MLDFERITSRVTATLVSSVLFGFIMLASLAACPFLLGASSQASDHPCCPRKPAPEKHCPASDNMAGCPYILTEAKLGKTEAKCDVSLAPALVSPIIHQDLNAAVVAVTMVSRDSDRSGSYLRNCLLRI